MGGRAGVFIDGNNWFHSLRHARCQHRLLLDYPRIAEKLLGPREWVATRYYIGQISQIANPILYAQQRSFLARLAQAGPADFYLPWAHRSENCCERSGRGASRLSRRIGGEN